VDPLRHLDEDLAALGSRGLLREPPAPSSPRLLDLCSNDYLGYAAEPCLPPAGWQPWPSLSLRSGAGASRLVAGHDPSHEEAETTLASWLGAEAALLFSSGYAANAGVLSALARPGDVIVSDALNHASIIDGCRLSGATVRVVPHCDASAVDAALAASTASHRWVVTEAYFSMDGDNPDLPSLRAICDRHDAALIVDEAHALGVFGPRGTGLCATAGIRPDVLVGTAGKALGLQGAFVAGSRRLRLWLWNRARSFVFSTGISPALASAIAIRARRAAADEPARVRLASAAARLREGLIVLGVAGGTALGGQGHIIPWVVGTPERAVQLSMRLREHGVRVQAIRPPTVPAGTSRLRITATAGLTDADIDRALQAFRAAIG
jgi:8-amino-7-oxononanoate synthase